MEDGGSTNNLIGCLNDYDHTYDGRFDRSDIRVISVMAILTPPVRQFIGRQADYLIITTNSVDVEDVWRDLTEIGGKYAGEGFECPCEKRRLGALASSHTVTSTDKASGKRCAGKRSGSVGAGCAPEIWMETYVLNTVPVLLSQRSTDTKEDERSQSPPKRIDRHAGHKPGDEFGVCEETKGTTRGLDMRIMVMQSPASSNIPHNGSTRKTRRRRV